ncbi:MAG: exodeoxyribonuclease VII small subunit [Methanosarcinales archaeon]|nr:exodeoxyribonuclease VII small subunit [Methanosarcinales archaeon]
MNAETGAETDVETSFEDKLKHLEDIVHELEGSGLTLDEALRKFEAGVKLSRLCHRRLDDAEMRIEELVEGGDGEVLHTKQMELETELPEP